MPRAPACVNVFLALVTWGASAARADEVTICYNYGCYATARVNYSETQLGDLQQLLMTAGGAAAARIRDRQTQRAYAVDSWYVDNGQPAVVVPVEDWRSGKISDGA